MKTDQTPCQPPTEPLRSSCPIACALDLLGDKWTLVVIRDVFLGRHTFGDFQNAPEKIPTNILADRLKRLEAAGIIHKQPYQERPARYTYHLTNVGKKLGPTLFELAKWSLLHLNYEGKPDPLSEQASYVRDRLLHPQ